MVPPYIGHTLSKVWVICVLVSQVFVFFGVFSTELLPLPCKITEVGRLSLFIEFFVGFHIVCDRYTLDNAHFTYFNTIWPLSLSSGFGSEVYPWPENLSYVDANMYKLCIYEVCSCNDPYDENFHKAKPHSEREICHTIRVDYQR